MQSDTSCHYSHLILFVLMHHLAETDVLTFYYYYYFLHTVLKVARPLYLGLSNMEVLVAIIDDGTVLTARSDVANTLCGDKNYNHQTEKKGIKVPQKPVVYASLYTFVDAAISTAFSVDTPSLG